MNERIRLLRKELGLTQQKFADALGISKENICSYEIGRRSPTSATIQLICNTFNINETWLLTGEGAMLAPVTRQQEIARIAAQLFKEEECSFRYQLINLISNMDEDQLSMIRDMAVKLVESTK